MTVQPKQGYQLQFNDLFTLQSGDVLRINDTLCVFEMRNGSAGILAYDGKNSHRGPSELFTFIGRPNSDGWMDWNGDHNPVPKFNVWAVTDTRPKIVTASDALNWDRTRHNHVVRFRILNKYGFVRFTDGHSVKPTPEHFNTAPPNDMVVSYVEPVEHRPVVSRTDDGTTVYFDSMTGGAHEKGAWGEITLCFEGPGETARRQTYVMRDDVIRECIDYASKAPAGQAADYLHGLLTPEPSPLEDMAWSMCMEFDPMGDRLPFIGERKEHWIHVASIARPDLVKS